MGNIGIEARIKQRRLQLLVHSCIYYDRDDNIVSDSTWNKWARELVELQKQYPEKAASVVWHDAFRGFDGSSGAFLPIYDDWVQYKADQLLTIRNHNQKKGKVRKPSTKAKTKKSGGRRVF